MQLNSRLTGIEDTQNLLRQRQEKITDSIRNLSKEVEDLKHAQSTVNTNAVTQEQLKELVRKVQEIDDKRVEDNKLVTKMLRDLQHALLAPLPGATKTPTPASAASSGEIYEYTVKKSDTSLSKIIDDRNSELKLAGLPTITLAEVKAANPGLDPNRIFAGKKIRLPQPVKK